jgi:hypothetical protein
LPLMDLLLMPCFPCTGQNIEQILKRQMSHGRMGGQIVEKGYSDSAMSGLKIAYEK